MQDRRRFKRSDVHSRCWCEGNNITLYVKVNNVGEGGLFVRTHAPFHSGEHARIRWRMPNSSAEVEAETIVRWTREHTTLDGSPPGMGVEFTGMNNQTLHAIRDYVEHTDESPRD